MRYPWPMLRALAPFALVPFALAATAAALVGSLATEAQAQDEDAEATQRARELFGAGVDAADAEDWPAAAESFREALALRDSPAIRLNLATALVELGERGEAVEQLTRIVEGDAPRRQVRQARAILRGLAPQVGHVTVDVAGDSEGASLRVGEHELPADRLSVPYAVEPGQVVVSAHRDGREIAREALEVAAGESPSILLTIAPPPEDVALDVEPEREPLLSDSEQGAPIYEEPWLWAAVGGGVLLVIIIAAAAAGGGQSPVAGDFEPGVVRF